MAIVKLEHVIRRQFRKVAEGNENVTIEEDPLKVIIGDDLYLTPDEIVTQEYTIPYRTIESFSLPAFSRERIEAGTSKQPGYDTVVIDTSEGEFVLDNLGEAVFPLNNVLHFIQRGKP